MMSFMAIIVCVACGIDMFVKEHPVLGCMDFVLACWNLQPAIEWLKSII